MRVLSIAVLFLVGCSRSPEAPSAESSNLMMVSGGLEILDLSEEQESAIREWEAQQGPDLLAKPERYFQFVESQLRSDQKSAFQSLVKGDANKVAEITMEKLKAASERFLADCRQLPKKAEDLRNDPGIDGWKGPYFQSILDPWGIPYLFEKDGEGIKVSTSGADRVSGTEDDLVLE